MSVTREIYEGFQRGELHRWDAVIAQDVHLNSPIRWNVVGLDALKAFANQLLTALEPRIDLIDEYEGTGNRAFLTVTLHWKHVGEFFGISPTGREGTSVETFIFTIEGGKVTKFDVSGRSLDLAIYLWARGWPHPHNMRPTPIVEGVRPEYRTLVRR
ncbi:MAG: ester cyclase [Chloroflexi bacterium]|nr:ester cyclase [Chloroflexota bacterium]